MFTTLLCCSIASSKNVHLQKAVYFLTHMTSETHLKKHLFTKGLPKNPHSDKTIHDPELCHYYITQRVFNDL
jgi:hypothetical protein